MVFTHVSSNPRTPPLLAFTVFRNFGAALEFAVVGCWFIDIEYHPKHVNGMTDMAQYRCGERVSE